MRRRTWWLVLALVATGCMSTARVRPDSEHWRTGVKTVAVMPAIRVYEVSAGDVSEQRDDWSAEGTRLVGDALSAGLADRGFTPRVLDQKAEKGDPELREVRLLYEEVGASIFQLVYGPFASPHAIRNFDYEVGPLDGILKRAHADALLVAYGRSHVSTAGRIVTRALFGGHVEVDLLTLGLLDRKGRLVWFDIGGSSSSDLRDERTVARLTETMLAHLPGEAP